MFAWTSVQAIFNCKEGKYEVRITILGQNMRSLQNDRHEIK